MSELVEPGYDAIACQVEEDWLGAPMYMSHFDAETSLRMVGEAGFLLEQHELLPQLEHGVEGFFLWIFARRR